MKTYSSVNNLSANNLKTRILNYYTNKIVNYPVLLGSIILISIGSISLSGCDDPNLKDITSGTYPGALVTRGDTATSQVLVTGQLTAQSDGNFSLHVAQVGGPGVWDFQGSVSSDTVTIQSPQLFPASIQAKGDFAKCYRSIHPAAPSTDPTTLPGPQGGDLHVCYSNLEITIIYNVSATQELTFVLDRKTESSSPAMEQPAPYTVSQLVTHTINQSFATRIQFQTAMQSKFNAQAAYANLLPSFSINTYLTLFVGVITDWTTTLTRMVGTLMPFLLPSNWLKADAAADQASADYIAYLIQKADSGSIIEGLTYSFLRDNASNALLSTYKPLIKGIRDDILEMEHLGIIAINSSLPITAVLNKLDMSQAALTDTINQERHSLSQGAGFVNAEAVQSITPITVFRVDNPTSYDPAATQTRALAVSLETKQMQALIKVAISTNNVKYFQWMDPSVGVSFNLPFSIEAGNAGIDGLRAQFSQLQSTVNQKVANILSGLNESLQAYNIAKTDVALQQSRIEDFQMKKRLGMITAADLTGFEATLNDALTSETNLITAKYAYEIASATLDRLIFAGLYKDIPTGKDHQVPPKPAPSN